MSTALHKRTTGAVTRVTSHMKKLNAEMVTTIATSFLKRIGHKGGLKPKRVSMEEGIYVVEVEMKKLTATIQVNAETHEITAYEIQPKGEESSFTSVSPKIIAITFGIAIAANIMLHFVFKIFGL